MEIHHTITEYMGILREDEIFPGLKYLPRNHIVITKGKVALWVRSLAEPP